MQQPRIAPPSSPVFSKSVTLCPRTLRMRAASMPAGPPPTIATESAFFAGARDSNASLPQAGLIAQPISFFAIMLSCQQPVRQLMQRRISPGLPICALTGQYGSARIWRLRPTRSVLPSAIIFSQKSGLRSVWLLMTGIATACLTATEA